MAFDFAPAKAVLTAHSTELVLPAGISGAAYLTALDEAATRFNKLTADAPEDSRLAATMAADMSKKLIEISLAGLAAFVAFTQVSEYPPLLSPRFFLMAATAGCFFISIMLGAAVVSGIWQRGEKRKTPPNAQAPWSTQPAAGKLNSQAGLGILAVILFAVLVVFYRPGPQTAQGFELTLPGGDRYITSGEFTVSGQWQNLCIVSKKTQARSQLTPTKSGQTDSITISPK